MAQQRAAHASGAYGFAAQDPRIIPVSSGKGAVRRSLDRLALIVCGTALGLILHAYVISIVVVEGDSMVPSLHRGDQIVIEKVTPRLGALERGDVVVLRKPKSEELLVKRVVAIGGESIRASEGRVYVDGEPVDESDYAVMSSGYFFPERTVAPNEVFVLGDNRENSDDSSTWGPVPLEQVIGRCVAGPLPLQREEHHERHYYARDDSAGQAAVHRPLCVALPRRANAATH